MHRKLIVTSTMSELDDRVPTDWWHDKDKVTSNHITALYTRYFWGDIHLLWPLITLAHLILCWCSKLYVPKNNYDACDVQPREYCFRSSKKIHKDQVRRCKKTCIAAESQNCEISISWYSWIPFVLPQFMYPLDLYCHILRPIMLPLQYLSCIMSTFFFMIALSLRLKGRISFYSQQGP